MYDPKTSTSEELFKRLKEKDYLCEIQWLRLHKDPDFWEIEERLLELESRVGKEGT